MDEEILRAVYDDVRRFAAVVAPPEIAPDDLLHDAIVRTLQRGSLARLDHPVAYLRRAVVNEASNARRSLGRARRANIRLVGGRQAASADAYPSDLAHLAMVTPTARAVLYLHEVEGRPFAEVADHLGVKEASVRKIASRAREKLRVALTEAS